MPLTACAAARPALKEADRTDFDREGVSRPRFRPTGDPMLLGRQATSRRSIAGPPWLLSQWVEPTGLASAFRLRADAIRRRGDISSWFAIRIRWNAHPSTRAPLPALPRTLTRPREGGATLSRQTGEGPLRGGEGDPLDSLFAASAPGTDRVRSSRPPRPAARGDLSRWGSDERNSPQAKARRGPSERARASHWASLRWEATAPQAGVRGASLGSVCTMSSHKAQQLSQRVSGEPPAQTFRGVREPQAVGIYRSVRVPTRGSLNQSRIAGLERKT
jgi:hypothetical protein